MAYISDIERLNYYEGEYLGALDFAAEQEYHREMRRRHNVGQHTWGIVSGLDLAQIPNGQTTGGVAQVDVYVQPGMAVDAFGREIVVLSRTQLTEDLFAAFYDPNATANPVYMYIWIAYDQQLAQLSGDACTRQNTSNPYSRVQESFRLLVTSTPTPVPPLNDPLVIDGNTMAPPVSPPPTPMPGDIVLPYDGSVPYQEFAQDDTTVHWYVLLGQMLWHPHFQVLLQTGPAALGRQYCGAVAAAIEAPNASLVIQDRMTPSPLPDVTYSGVSVEVQGALTVDRLLTALQDLWIYEYGHLNFKDSGGSDGDTPLWMRRITNPNGGADLHIHIGDNSDAKNKPQRLTVANGPTGDESKEQIVFDVRADGNVDIPIGALNFASQTRQMLNLWSTAYGIGVQAGTEYFRTDGIFCWFRQGQHSDTKADPGSGGTLAMMLDESSTLTVNGNAIVNGGTLGRDDGPLELHLWGSKIGDTGSNILYLRCADNGSVVFDTNNSNVVIDTSKSHPALSLDVKGDLGRDDGPLELHLWGSRIGDTGSDILYLRCADNGSVVFDTNNSNVVIDTSKSHPALSLDVKGDLGRDDGPLELHLWGSKIGDTGSNILYLRCADNGSVKFDGIKSNVWVIGNLGTHGQDPDSGYPLGWAGGIHTTDVYAEGSIGCKGLKSFIIPHPLDSKAKHLVHCALEGPEGAVFYRGQARLAKGNATITLPDYFEALTRKENRTVLLTPKFTKGASIAPLAASEVQDGKFTVHSPKGSNPAQEFFWEVKAVRSDVDPLQVEVPKTPVTRRKDHPARQAATVKS